MPRQQDQKAYLLVLIKFCVPLILSGILQQLYNWADAFIVGNAVGEQALAAVGVAGSVTNLFLLSLTGFTLGLGILFARQFGSGAHEAITRALSVFTVLLGAAFLAAAALGIAFSGPLLRMLDTPADTFGMAESYLRIILTGIPVMAVYNVYTAALRGAGDSRAPFFSVLLSSVVNVALDLLFVPGLRMGVNGAALATVLSQAAMTVFLIRYSRRYAFLRFRLTGWKAGRAVLREGAALGVPPMLQSCINAAGNLVLQNFMNGFGTQTVAAITTAYRVDTIIFLPMINIGSGISTIVAQSCGAGRQKDAPRIVKAGLTLMVTVSLGLTALVIPFGGALISLFGVGPEAVAIGGGFFARIASFYVVYGICMSLRGYLEGVGDVLYSSLGGITALGCRILFSYSFAGVCGNMIIAYAEAASWGVMLVLYIARILWLRKKGG